MLRADNVVCGTSSTGTGTLTLAACPAPPGGLDFDKWLKATGFNFVSTNAVLVSYTIIEYTSAAFTTAKQTEKGIGTLTLGASITAATLARTTVQSTVTGEDTSTPAPTFSAPTAITIGTAANTLVFVGASAADTLAGCAYYDSGSSSHGLYPLGSYGQGGTTNAAAQNGAAYYIPFCWAVPMLVKKLTACSGGVAYSGGTSNVYAALYAVGTDGRPGKRLIDFGGLGTAGSALAATFTSIVSASHASGFLLLPGFYWAAIFVALSGGSGVPDFMTTGTDLSGLGPSILGGNGVNSHLVYATATATANPAPDPATNTGYFAFPSNSGSGNNPPLFMLGP